MERAAGWVLGLGALVLVGCGGARAARRDATGKAQTPAPATQTAASAEAQAAPHALTDDEAWHLLSRFAFGPRPGDVSQVKKMGAEAWFEAQLAFEDVPDDRAEQAAQVYHLAFADAAELAFGVAKLPEDMEPIDDERERRKALRRTVVQHYALATATRHVLSERQLFEVMVDFWTNHFNVNVNKGQVRLLLGSYVEDAIRPHALSRFEDLLMAVVRHPAMLVYLDNARSSVSRPGPKGERGGMNENFARELLELHTVGVDGGYDQKDVIEAARVLTGWGVDELAFAYKAAQHDPGDKVIMGHRIEGGDGLEEVPALLRFLASHPSTARFLAHKLAVRFVCDAPSEALVRELAKAYLASNGDVRAVLRAIFESEEFWAEAHRGAKVKSALEFVVSALRATGGRPEGDRFFLVLRNLGQPLFGQPVPTGYPETGDRWANSAQVSGRWQVAFGLASGGLPGVAFSDRDALFPPVPEEALARIGAQVLGPRGGETLARIEREARAIERPDRRRTAMLALALASPEFQRQ